jgi:hypothetical protein
MGINTSVLRAKVKFKSALRKGKAYVMTARRKLALKAAQLASATKRKGRMAVASVGGNTKMLRAKVKTKEALKKTKAIAKMTALKGAVKIIKTKDRRANEAEFDKAINQRYAEKQKRRVAEATRRRQIKAGNAEVDRKLAAAKSSVATVENSYRKAAKDTPWYAVGQREYNRGMADNLAKRGSVYKKKYD